MHCNQCFIVTEKTNRHCVCVFFEQYTVSLIVFLAQWSNQSPEIGWFKRQLITS